MVEIQVEGLIIRAQLQDLLEKAKLVTAATVVARVAKVERVKKEKQNRMQDIVI